MRRKDREMAEAFALDLLDRCDYATMATVSPEGVPYCTPLSIARDGALLYFHCAHEGKKIDHLRHNATVCLSCVADLHIPEGMFTTEYSSALVTGTAEEVHDEAEKIHALRLICLRYTPGNMAAFDAAIQKSLGRTAIWKIPIQEISAKRKKYDAHGEEMKFGRTE